MRNAMFPRLNPRRSMAGVSLIELMIAMTLGLIVLAALVSVFANSSAARSEMERSARQIENGRYAVELLTDDLRHAGFYGEATVRSGVPTSASPGSIATPKTIGVPAAMPDPCSTDPNVWFDAMLLAVQGYDNGSGIGATACGLPSRKPNTDVLVVRRVSTCEAGVGTCAATANGQPYLQVSKCSTETPLTPFTIGAMGAIGFPLTVKDCATRAGMRQYLVHIYYISTNNGAGVAIPTLVRMDFNGAGFAPVPLVEGIEEFNVEYGIDNDGDGAPNDYTPNPDGWAGPPGGCVPAGSCTQVANWSNVVSVRLFLLARNIDPSPGYVDAKTYTLGHDALGGMITVTPGDAYRRHVYSSLVRVVNSAERRDTP
jgi:type IV pilus assembly protein PilW